MSCVLGPLRLLILYDGPNILGRDINSKSSFLFILAFNLCHVKGWLILSANLAEPGGASSCRLFVSNAFKSIYFKLIGLYGLAW